MVTDNRAFIGFRLPRAETERLDAECRAHGATRSGFIRMALDAELSRRETARQGGGEAA